ncbi:MAG: hypothetical protein ACTH8F_11305 [Microbacterium sp.]|uniref:hypothetical protein n=1 Tax=Microbacterium sp. TaxID=51671 RepID=UPI003F9AE8EB
MKRRKDLRTGIAALGILSLIAVGSVSATPTEAAWTEPEYAAGTAITAVSLEKPTIRTCQAGSVLGLLITSLSFSWTSTMPIERQQHYLNGTLGTVLPTITGPVNGVYTYSVSYNQGLLTLLLSLLTAEVQIEVRTGAGSWSSSTDHWEARKVLLGTACGPA